MGAVASAAVAEVAAAGPASLWQSDMERTHQVTVTYTNTRRDLRALAAHHYPRARSTWVSLGLFVLATTPITVSSLEIDFGPVVNVLTVATIEAILTGILSAFYALIIVIALAFQRHPGILTEHTIDVGPDGLTESTDVNVTMTKWPGVSKVQRTRRHLFVYTGPGMAHIIPRRAFATKDDWDRFSETVTAHQRAHA